MRLWDIGLGVFAVLLGLYGFYEALTAKKFENMAGGITPPEDQRYARATVRVRVAVAILALAFVALGVWTLVRTSH